MKKVQMTKIFQLLFASFLLLSCKRESPIEGLWVVQEVKVGNRELTPDARWTRFNSDFTQESGNGWYQHSQGTWDLNAETGKLSIANTNGIIDENEPFSVRFEDSKMYWTRLEEGAQVQVMLEKAEKLPSTNGDKVMGLWQLNESIGEGQYFKKTGISDYLLLRWDRKFVIRSDGKKIYGVFNVNGHKPEIELIPYGEGLERDFWSIEFGQSAISLKLRNAKEEVTRKFVRIDQFPK